MSFLLLSCISVSCISDSQEVWRKERIFSKAGESECPAVQILPLGRAPHALVTHYKYPRAVRVGGSVLCARAGETTDSRGAARSRRATLTSHEEKKVTVNYWRAPSKSPITKWEVFQPLVSMVFKDKIHIIYFMFYMYFYRILSEECWGASSIQRIENKNLTFLYLSVYRTLNVVWDSTASQFSRKAT